MCSGTPDTRKAFEVSIKLVVANQRGVLAKVAGAENRRGGSNIQNVTQCDPEVTAGEARRRSAIVHHHALHPAGVEPPRHLAPLHHAQPAQCSACFRR
jgi:hypothetical protein